MDAPANVPVRIEVNEDDKTAVILIPWNELAKVNKKSFGNGSRRPQNYGLNGKRKDTGAIKRRNWGALLGGFVNRPRIGHRQKIVNKETPPSPAVERKLDNGSKLFLQPESSFITSRS
jgi:hypothetical protein